MQIDVFDEQNSLKISKLKVKEIVKYVISSHGEHCDEIAIYFVDKEKIGKLHEQFFGDPTPTDCISLPMDDESEKYRILGEIFICPQVALEYAKENNLNPFLETTLYLVHSLLHLLGFDDINDHDIKIMRKEETRCLEHLVEKGMQLEPL